MCRPHRRETGDAKISKPISGQEIICTGDKSRLWRVGTAFAENVANPMIAVSVQSSESSVCAVGVIITGASRSRAEGVPCVVYRVSNSAHVRFVV